MKKNIALSALLILCAIEGWRVHQLSNRPNNQYELTVSPKGYVLKDGSRTVGQFEWYKNKSLDSLVLSDNQ